MQWSRVVSRIGAAQNHDAQFHFTVGPHLVQVSTWAWYAALERAGIEDFCWHDLRHTWASWHAQQGTPPHVLQELGGWESAQMVRRYAHPNAEHLAPYADRLWTLEVVDAPIVGTIWSQA